MGAKHSKPVQHDSSILPPIDESREVQYPYVAINPWHAYIRCRFRRQAPRCRTISDRALLRIIESDALLREAHTGPNIPAAVAAFLVDPDNVARTLGMLTTAGPNVAGATAATAADAGGTTSAAELHPKARDTARAMLTKALTRRRHRARGGNSASSPSAVRPGGSSGGVHKVAAAKRAGKVPAAAVNGAVHHRSGGAHGAAHRGVNGGGSATAANGAGGTATTPRAGASATNGAAAANGAANGHGSSVQGPPGRRPPVPGPNVRKGLSWWSRIMVAVTVVAIFQSRPRLGQGARKR